MKLFAHLKHVYEDRATHRTYEIAAGKWLEIPDAIGAILLAGHPSKLCDVTAEADPSHHVCAKSRFYEVSQLQPEHTVVIEPRPGSGRVAAGRREKQRNTYARSSVARHNRANAAKGAA